MKVFWRSWKKIMHRFNCTQMQLPIDELKVDRLITSLAGDCYQGYYACKPVPIGEFLDFYRGNIKG